MMRRDRPGAIRHDRMTSDPPRRHLLATNRKAGGLRFSLR